MVCLTPVAGGSSTINAGFYSRADQYFNPKSGLSWDLTLVNQSGWRQSTIRDSLLEEGPHPYNEFTFEHGLGTKIGGSTFDSVGRRHSAADLLSNAKPSNIRVSVHASVERILLAATSSASEN
ncbi:hypothetical protein V2J09_011063 [Rumex salicifolius]